MSKKSKAPKNVAEQTAFPGPHPILAPNTDELDENGRREFLKNFYGAQSLNDVPDIEQTWLWPGRIPLHYVTLLVGDPGVGKSVLTLELAARVSRGAPWPDQAIKVAVLPSRTETETGRKGKPDAESSISLSPGLPVSPSPILPLSPSSVLLLTAEDVLQTTVRPRLEEAGADCSRIKAVSMLPSMRDFAAREKGINHLFDLRGGTLMIRGLIDEMRDCRLVILDSMSMLMGDNQFNSKRSLADVLLRLSSLARCRDLAVVIISHVRKKEGRAIHCSLGSVAYAATARSVWAVAKDGENPGGRLLLPIKNNLAPDASGLAFTIESGPVRGAPMIRWSPDPVNRSTDAALSGLRSVGRPDEERQHAKHWLIEQLAAGPCAMREIREAADANGYSRNTLRRAFRDLHGKATKGSTPNGPWIWQLPVEDTQNYRGEFWAPSISLGESASTPLVSQ